MKKLILTFFIAFVLFSLAFSTKEISEFNKIYRANSLYIQNNLSGALDIYSQINEDTIEDSNQDILNYLKGNILYKQGKYFEALKQYEKSSFEDNKKLQFYKKNVIGNINYRLGEFGNNDDKLKYWQDALDIYKNAINLDVNEDKKNTLYNYNLVKKKLDELKKKLEEEKKKQDEEKQKEQQKQEEKQSEKQNEQTSSGTSDKQDSNKTSTGGQDSQKETQQNISGRQWKNGGEFNSVGNNNSGSTGSKLTPEEKKELNSYSNSLKDFQKNNWQYLQRGEQGKQDSPNDIFNRMMNEFQDDPFFKNVIPQNEIEKDW